MKKNEILTKIPEKKKWSKSELARRAGVAWQTIDRAESGQPIARVSQLKIASALEVVVDKLFGRV